MSALIVTWRILAADGPSEHFVGWPVVSGQDGGKAFGRLLSGHPTGDDPTGLAAEPPLGR